MTDEGKIIVRNQLKGYLIQGKFIFNKLNLTDLNNEQLLYFDEVVTQLLAFLEILK